MKLTNKYQLPATIINVIKRPQYSKGSADISVTELINSPRIVQLKHKHWDDIEEDASEMVWSLFGTAVHNILQHGKDNNHIVEERLFTEFDGWRISGAIDLQELNDKGVRIVDYKTVSAWAAQNIKADWHNQLNIYAWLVERVKGIPVTDLAIIAIVRDWSARDAATRENYPQAPIVTIDIPLWTFEKRQQFILDRINLHSHAYFESHGGELPPCTPEEMWEKPTTWAVKKEGAARAKSVHSSLEEAELAVTKGYIIETREGERTRCKSYCQVAPFCSQFQTYLKEKTNE